MSMANTIANLSYEAILATKADIETQWEMKEKYPKYDTLENFRRERKNREKLTKFTTIGPKSDPVKISTYILTMMVDQVKLLDGLTNDETRDSLVIKATIENDACIIAFMNKFIAKNNITSRNNLMSVLDSKEWFHGAILNSIKDYVGDPAEHIAGICRNLYIDFVRALNMTICEFIYMKHVKIDKSMIFGFFVQAGISNYLLSEIDSAVPTIPTTRKTPAKNSKKKKEKEKMNDDEDEVEDDNEEEENHDEEIEDDNEEENEENHDDEVIINEVDELVPIEEDEKFDDVNIDDLLNNM